MQELKHILQPRYRLWSHLLFWVSYVVFFTFLYGNAYEDYTKAFISISSTLPVKIIATYITLYLLIPKLIDRKMYVSFGLLMLCSAILFGFLDRFMLHLYFVPTYYPDYDYAAYPLIHLGKAARNMISVYTVVFAATAIKLVKRTYQTEKITQELAREKLDAELKFLKAQIHPHFLFNTLNNLYALTLQNASRASEVVLKLSNLMDYMLYEANASQVSLNREIEQMNNLIELEKLRYADRLDVSFTSRGDTSNKQIPPLLMLPFVENAFKHGISQKLEESFISIDLHVKQNRLTLRVENSRDEDQEQSPYIQSQDYTRGIGLKNVKRRLELIYGPGNYDLQVLKEEGVFMIVLRIPLQPLPQSVTESIEALPISVVPSPATG